MTVVIPFCAKDAALAENLARWIYELGDCERHYCLLVADSEAPWNTALSVLSWAKKAFSIARLIVVPHVDGWIPGSNALFNAAAIEMEGEAFLWLEPDATPLARGWLDQIQNFYLQAKRKTPFVGSLVSHNNRGFPTPYFEGVAVYPEDAWEIMKAKWNPAVSWVYACAEDVVPFACDSWAFQHLWGEDNNPPKFAKTSVPGTSTLSLDSLRKDAVVFHRCKDGSLIKLLRERMGITDTFGLPELRVVSLRRAGDIIALLPALKHLSKTKRVSLVVHKEFAGLLDGVDYVTPILWQGDWEEPLKAAKEHRAVNAQVFGKGVNTNRVGTNFVRAAWNAIGLNWSRYLPLDVPRRKPILTTGTLGSFIEGRPIILVKLNGFSSPFPYEKLVKDAIHQRYGSKAIIVDLDAVRFDSIYGMIYLMDMADCLVSSDTVTLHLCRGSKCPVIAFVNDTEFGGSPAVGNVVLRMPYRDVQKGLIHVTEMLDRCVSTDDTCNIKKVVVYSDWIPRNQEDKERHNRAFDTWKKLNARLLPYQGGRSSASMGDNRDMPFIHDMVQRAMETGDERIIAITNNDIQFGDKLSQAVTESCNRFGCYWAYRIDPITQQTDNGVDFVAFTRKWWSIHKHLYPDFLLGYWWWDDIIARVMMWSGLSEGTRLYYHEAHPLATTTRPNTPGSNYNQKLALQWLSQHNEHAIRPCEQIIDVK